VTRSASGSSPIGPALPDSQLPDSTRGNQADYGVVTLPEDEIAEKLAERLGLRMSFEDLKDRVNYY